MAIAFQCDRCGKRSQGQSRRKPLIPAGWGQVCKVVRKDGIPIELEIICPDCAPSVAGMSRLPKDKLYGIDLPGSVDFWIRVDETEVKLLIDKRFQRAMARRLHYWLTNHVPQGIYKALLGVMAEEKARCAEQDRATGWKGFRNGKA